jgi:hypothetical protein
VSLPSMGSIVVYLHKECAVVGVLGELPRLLAHLEEADSIESSKTRASLETIMLVFWSECQGLMIPETIMLVFGFLFLW